MEKMLTEKAAEMVIMDALEKGKSKEEVIAYMKSQVFADAVSRYVKMFEELLPSSA
jgi:hypothetical protein